MAEPIDYEPTRPEADLLLAASQDYAATMGDLGGALGSQPGWASEQGKIGAAGGKFGTRHFTRPRSAAATADVACAPAEAQERARAGLAEMGDPIGNPNGTDDGSLWALMPSGFGGMAPALVRVDVQVAPAGARVQVRATGREGLIKQGIASKAVDRVIAAVSGSPRQG